MSATPAPLPTADAALLESARFITAHADSSAEPVNSGAVHLFSTTVNLASAPVARARILATAHGIYDLALNGAPVSGDLFSPGWSSYEWRLPYQEWDVTALVQQASLNAAPDGEAPLTLSARLGNGWYRGDFGFGGALANYGEDLGLLAVLEITSVTGEVQVVATSPDWHATTGEIVENSIYLGQRIDARLRHATGPELTVRVAPFDRTRLFPRIAEPITRQDVLAPQAVWTSPSGRTLIDFGQNLVGWIRLTVTGPEGTEITLRHAEVLEHGELGTRPLRNATSTDTFVLAGTGEETFEPTFTFHGFRYAEVSGWPGEFSADAVRAVVVHNDPRPTSTFSCSDERVNQLISNSIWGQKGNFFAVPTDCPQRDERLGWTGDIAAYAATAAFQFDVADFLHGWLLDLAVETTAAGFVPVTVPDVIKHGHFDGGVPFADAGAQAIWSDAAVWVPQALWQAYGDRSRLAAHYPGMVAHLESVEPLLSGTGLWDQGSQLADWLDPDAPPNDPAAAKADPGVVATASLYRSATFAAEAAELLGRSADAVRWLELAQRVRTGFRAHYVSQIGGEFRVVSDCATVYALAITFGLLDGEENALASDRLAHLVAERDYRVTTGFAGTPFITWALSEHGNVETAYRLLLETGCPSWLYPITMGATTIWERWDSMLPDGTINPGDMTSFNHYALGAVADWIYQVIGGVRAAAPGYSRVLIQPVPGPGITWARTGYDARVGRIETSWSTTAQGTFSLEVTLPDGIPAEVVLPDGSSREVPGGRHTFECQSPAPGLSR